MKKANKKILFVLTMAIISTMLLTSLQAYDAAGDKCICDDIEYTYKDMTEEKAVQIVHSMLGKPEDPPAPRWNLLCLFGHDIKTGTITLTEHNYYTTAPRCRVTISDVEYCNRSGCDYFAVIKQYIYREVCH